MQLTHVSVVSVLAAASGANALSIAQFLGFDKPQPVAPVAAPGPFNSTGGYNYTGNSNLTERFHARAVPAVVDHRPNATGPANLTGPPPVGPRSVPEVVVNYNGTHPVNGSAPAPQESPRPESPRPGNWTKAPRFRAARRALPHFGGEGEGHGHGGGYGHHNGTNATAPLHTRAVAGAVAAVDSAVAAGSCAYPAQYTLTHVTTFAPNFNSSASYVSFAYADAATDIQTTCSYNETSTSLTAGTGLAPRYACDDAVVSFIWSPLASSNSSLRAATAYGKLTLIEQTCPGETTTTFESTGSVEATSLRCTKINGANATAATELSTGSAGVLCSAVGSLVGNFTSLQPSPLQ